jgi:hypothetical protein
VKSLLGISCALAACSTAPASHPSGPAPAPPPAAPPASSPVPGAAPSPAPPPPPPAAASATSSAPAVAAPAAPSKLIRLDGDGVSIVGIGFDAQQALYVAGVFSAHLTAERAAIRSPAADQRAQLFVARLRPQGDVDWLIHVGSPHPADLSGMAVAPDGSVALVGFYEWTIGPDHGPAAPAQMDAFVIFVGADGKVRWERRIDGKERQLAFAVHRTADGDVLVGGAFAGPTRFGPAHRATSTPGPHVASLDCFLARYSTAGDVEWLATGGGPDDDRILGVTATPGGDVIVSGSLGPNAALGAAPHQIVLRGATGPSRIGNPDRPFVASYAPTGALRWAVEVGAKDTSHAPLPRPLADGTVLVHGWDQDLAGPRTGFLAHVDARGNLLHRRELPELGALSLDAAPSPSLDVLSARAAGAAIVFERHTATATSPEGPPLQFPARTVGLTVSALARGADGRVAVAGTTGELTETKLSGTTTAISFENVDGYIALAPSIGALRTR